MIRRLLAVAALAVLAVAYWWRKNPSACPYSQRFWEVVGRNVLEYLGLPSDANPDRSV